MKVWSHINFLGTIGTAGILLWGVSQSKPKPEYSPTYIQARTLPKPTRRTAIRIASKRQNARDRRAAIDIASKPQSVPVKTPVHLIKDVTIETLCKLHDYASIEPKQPSYQSASKEYKGNPATHFVPKLESEQVKRPVRLVKDLTMKRSCKLRDYTAVEQPAYQSASKETVENEDGFGRPAEIKVTPPIRDVMNKIRPKQITGTITVEGKEYEFGSGGRGQSIPYGDYLITPDAIGSWGSRHGAIGVANGTIADPKLHRDRDGIELHAAGNSKLETNGCVSIRKDQWPEFRKQVLAMVRKNKKVYLHVSDQGASISTSPFEFIGKPVSKPTFRDVLSLLEAPARKTAD